jgi:hypothetical protein
MTHTRETIQQMFVRVCRDSGFKLDTMRAATLAARVLGISPLEIWIALPSLNVMDQIAAGTHPAAHRAPASTSAPSSSEARE